MGYRFYSEFNKLVLFFFLSTSFAIAAETSPLPQPLTLEVALQYANNADQYQLISAEQKLQQAIANVTQAGSINDLNIELSGYLRKVGPSELGDEDEDDDSKVSLFVRKPIYDFGRSASSDHFAELNVELRQLEKAYLIEQREISIIEKYFDVLNSDNEFLRYNEGLATAFIRYDRARENQQLGLASEIDVLELQAAYEVIRQHRNNSENMQRFTRMLLAEELGFPKHPSSEVALPVLATKTRISDDVDLLVEQAFQHSLLLKIQQKKLEISMQAIEIASHSIGPSLDAELELSEYARDGPTRDDWRASLYFDLPLYSGSAEQSLVAVASARHRQALSDLSKIKAEIRIAVLKLWQSIRQNSIRLEGEIINQEFRDMYLDKSRAEYELEFKTDLGDSMVQFSDSRKNVFETRFALEVAWRKLEKLVGPDFLKTIQSDEGTNG